MSESPPHDLADTSGHRVQRLLADFRPASDSCLTVEMQEAVYLARALQATATELQTPQERRQQAEFDRMIHHPGDKATLMQMTDQAFRSHKAARAADQLIHILDVQGVPRFFSTIDWTLLKGFQSFGGYLPGVAMPFVKEKMQQETANVILPAEPDLLSEHLRSRWQEGVRMNVNYLGEAVLSEPEAQRRLENYLAALQAPEIEVVSVKISTIYSQISALAREHTIDVLCDRLELLYRAAAKSTFQRHDGTVVPKFVYLDMEEYRDKELTAEAFMRTLDRPGLESVEAGLALQAYLPDSFLTQQRINKWARRRVANGGAAVTLRIVKGANMEMERVDAALAGWPQATYQSKLETDANTICMLQEGMRAENLTAVRLGVASHNLFTLAYGCVLAARAGALDRVQFEMLEGMANHQRRALFQLTQNMLLYAPACQREEFTSAIGYLVRRLDENTGPDNFLRHAFSITVDSSDWQRLQQQFLDSFAELDSLSHLPRRTMDRRRSAAPHTVAGGGTVDSPFVNEPDTDWSLPQHSAWAQSLVDHWLPRCDARAAEIPLVVAGAEVAADRRVRDALDPSRPGVVVARYREADDDDVALAIDTARRDPSGWRALPVDARAEILTAVADELAARRGELLGAMLAEGGKILTESDPEVSEAIDFCRFYARSADYFAHLPGMTCAGRGVVAVVSPWNFPLAIPCGGVAAALAAGNTVILKPASDTVLVAWLMCEAFWQAGVPRTALQMLPCRGATVGQRLVTDHAVDAVILTGGTATAQRLLQSNAHLHLLAETGGKNATIVTALSDRDQAIKNVLHSAFSHSGQKCSATSLLLLEDEVYEDARFRENLCDAVESLSVGSAWELPTRVGPLIRPPGGELEKALKELEVGESWAVMPHWHVDQNPQLVSPGVKWGVQPGSVTHCTEFFGPLLATMRFRDLHEAIELVNATGYGLTSGLESLDDREQEIWQQGIRAGNLYLNRPTTGAIVWRQPFGGMGRSAVGPGIKAGGPNYVVPLMNCRDSDRPPSDQPTEHVRAPATAQDGPPLEVLYDGLAQSGLVDDDELARLATAIASYQHWAQREFHTTHDHFRLVGEDNVRRYLPVGGLRIRLHADDTAGDIFCRAVAARAVGCRATVSAPPGLVGMPADALRLLDELTGTWAGGIEFVEETEGQLVEVIRRRMTDRLRYAAPERVSTAIRQAAATALQFIAAAPVLAQGRVELLWYVQEQSTSARYHRYGNLGRRAGEARGAVL